MGRGGREEKGSNRISIICGGERERAVSGEQGVGVLRELASYAQLAVAVAGGVRVR